MAMTTAPPLELVLDASVHTVSLSIKIADKSLATATLTGIGLSALYYFNRAEINNAISGALAALGRALNFRPGSVIFDLVVDLALIAKYPLDFIMADIKQRLEIAFQQIGFKGDFDAYFNVTLMNISPCYSYGRFNAGINYPAAGQFYGVSQPFTGSCSLYKGFNTEFNHPAPGQFYGGPFGQPFPVMNNAWMPYPCQPPPMFAGM